MKSKKQQRKAAKGKHARGSYASQLLGEASAEPVLSAELEAELGIGSADGSNALVLAGSKKRRREEGRQEEPAPTLSKSQKRKLRRLQEEKEARKKREAVLRSLEQHRLSEDQQQLLIPSGAIGQSETLKQKLHRAMQFQKAGLAPPPDSRLFREREVGGSDEEEGDKGWSGGDKGCLGVVSSGATATAGDAAVVTNGVLEGDNAPAEGVDLADDDVSEERGDVGGKRGKTRTKLRIAGDDVMEEELEVRRRSGAAAGPVNGSGGWGKGGAAESEGRDNGKKHKKGARGSEDHHGHAGNALVEEQSGGERAKIGPEGDSLELPNSEKLEGSKASKKRKKNRGAGGEPPEGPESAPAPPTPQDNSQAAIPPNSQQGLSTSTPLPETQKEGVRRTPFVRTVKRSLEVEEARLGLPILGMEQEIMEAVAERDLVVVCGETGCGKTTQVPQFLFEAGYGSKECAAHPGIIGVTQPRRVAALATARRVAEELGVKLGEEVGFQVRYDRRVGGEGAIKFMTDGILLREVQSDFLLRQYSCVIIDEAHERSLNTDVLIGLLSRIVPLRRQLSLERPDLQPLKLIIMSATLRIEDFVGNERLCPTPPPVVKVSARQFPVTVHFSKRTELVDYVGAAEKKVCAIHKQLPPGGVLVFLTGQREVEDLCKRLRRAFAVRHSKPPNPLESAKNGLKAAGKKGETKGAFVSKGSWGLTDEVIAEAADGDDVEGGLGFGRDEMDGDAVNGDGSEGEEGGGHTAGARSHPANGKRDSAEQSTGDRDEALSQKEGSDSDADSDENSPGPLHVLPLYAMLPAAAQLRVFGDPPEGHRLVVVATNVAETSLTIPGIRYVVDCGRAKERTYERGSGMSKFEVKWISKASADQRAGRAGRVGPGHCYRLYSSAMFNDHFPQHAPPEIESAPIEGVVLQMKAMGIEKVVNFPFPTPPDRSALSSAERTLISLSALHPRSTIITPLGKSMSAYPISPRHARMLLAALEMGENLKEMGKKSKKMGEMSKLPKGTRKKGLRLLAHAIAAAAALSSESPFLREGFGVLGEKEGEAEGVGLKGKGEFADDWDADANERREEKAKSKAADEEKERRKKRRSAARAAHAKFTVQGSEALSAATALRAYEKAVAGAGERVSQTGPSAGESFCHENHLHARTMKEMAQLRQQLTRLVGANLEAAPDLEPGTKGPILNRRSLEKENIELLESALKEPLGRGEEAKLRRAVCAGWADRIARKLRPGESVPGEMEESKSRRAVRYQACSASGVVFLHPGSSMAKDAPDFVCYTDLMHTEKRTYMQGVSAVDVRWLPVEASALCQLSKPLADPPPWYEPEGDRIMCWVQPTFGPQQWTLPLHATELKPGKTKTAAFAVALLQGRVLRGLGVLDGSLTGPSTDILRPDAAGQKRVGEMLARLAGFGVDSREGLRKRWEAEPRFLYEELALWVQAEKRGVLAGVWEGLLREAGVGA